MQQSLAILNQLMLVVQIRCGIQKEIYISWDVPDERD